MFWDESSMATAQRLDTCMWLSASNFRLLVMSQSASSGSNVPLVGLEV